MAGERDVLLSYPDGQPLGDGELLGVVTGDVTPDWFVVKVGVGGRERP